MKNTSVFDSFCCPNLSWSQDGPQEPPKSPRPSIVEAFLANFGICLLSSSPFFGRCLSFLSAPAVGRRSNRKQNADDWSGHGGGEAEGKWITYFGELGCKK